MRIAILACSDFDHRLAHLAIACEQKMREIHVLVIDDSLHRPVEPPSFATALHQLAEQLCASNQIICGFNFGGQFKGQILPPAGVYPSPAARTPATRFKKRPRKPG